MAADDAPAVMFPLLADTDGTSTYAPQLAHRGRCDIAQKERQRLSNQRLGPMMRRLDRDASQPVCVNNELSDGDTALWTK